MHSPRKNPSSVSTRQSQSGIEWPEYPFISPGEYTAYCRFAKKYFDPGFRRWVCILRWDVLSHDLMTVIATVPCWFALGR